MFIPSASFVEIDKSRGLSFLKCAFAAINTGVSVIPLANLAMVLPVQGMITKISRRLFGPIGSAWDMVRIGSIPVTVRAFSINSSGDPNLLLICWEESEKILCISAPSLDSFCNSVNTFL